MVNEQDQRLEDLVAQSNAVPALVLLLSLHAVPALILLLSLHAVPALILLLITCGGEGADHTLESAQNGDSTCMCTRLR